MFGADQCCATTIPAFLLWITGRLPTRRGPVSFTAARKSKQNATLIIDLRRNPIAPGVDHWEGVADLVRTAHLKATVPKPTTGRLSQTTDALFRPTHEFLRTAHT